MSPKTTNSLHGQQTISSFFARKRKSSPIDLTVNSDLPVAKRIKGGDKGSLPSSSLREFDSSEPSAEPRLSPLPIDDVLSSHKGKGKGKRSRSTGNVCFREKLERRDLIEKGIRVGNVETSQMASHSANVRQSEEVNTLPWERGGSSRQHRKGNSVIGPAGLPCTPLEEAVNVADTICLFILEPSIF